MRKIEQEILRAQIAVWAIKRLVAFYKFVSENHPDIISEFHVEV